MAIIISLEPCSVQTHTYPVYLCTCIYPLSTRAYNNNLQVLSDAAASTVEPFRTSTFPYKQMSSDFPSLVVSLVPWTTLVAHGEGYYYAAAATLRAVGWICVEGFGDMTVRIDKQSTGIGILPFPSTRRRGRQLSR